MYLCLFSSTKNYEKQPLQFSEYRVQQVELLAQIHIWPVGELGSDPGLWEAMLHTASLCHGAESWHSMSAAFGTWVSLKFHQGKEKNFRGIWSTFSFPSSKTNDHNPVSHRMNALRPAPCHPCGPGTREESRPQLGCCCSTQRYPARSQLTNGHNFFNAAKLFMNEQGGAVVTPKPLWLGREDGKEKGSVSLLRWRQPLENSENETSWFL